MFVLDSDFRGLPDMAAVKKSVKQILEENNRKRVKLDTMVMPGLTIRELMKQEGIDFEEAVAAYHVLQAEQAEMGMPAGTAEVEPSAASAGPAEALQVAPAKVSKRKRSKMPPSDVGCPGEVEVSQPVEAAPKKKAKTPSTAKATPKGTAKAAKVAPRPPAVEAECEDMVTDEEPDDGMDDATVRAPSVAASLAARAEALLDEEDEDEADLVIPAGASLPPATPASKPAGKAKAPEPKSKAVSAPASDVKTVVYTAGKNGVEQAAREPAEGASQALVDFWNKYKVKKGTALPAPPSEDSTSASSKPAEKQKPAPTPALRRSTPLKIAAVALPPKSAVSNRSEAGKSGQPDTRPAIVDRGHDRQLCALEDSQVSAW